MIYKSVSIKEVMGRVVRNTRLRDSSLLNDIGEWIPEAMGYLKTRQALSLKWADVDIDFHKGRLPCGLRTLTAVTYNGCRLRYNNSGMDLFTGTKAADCCGDDNTVFISQPKAIVKTETVKGISVFTTTISLTGAYLFDYIDVDGVRININLLGFNASVGSVATLQTYLVTTLGLTGATAVWVGSFTDVPVLPAQIVVTIPNERVTAIGYHRVVLDGTVVLFSLVVTGHSDTLLSYQTNSLESIVAVNKLSYGNYSYYTELDYINTSLCDGCVRIFYKALPVDEDGYPLIPDNEHYKEALYWYVRSKMIGLGYKDPAFNIQYCDEKWERHANKAISEIRYPSVDQVETSQEISTRLILPGDYFESLFNNPGKEGMIDVL